MHLLSLHWTHYKENYQVPSASPAATIAIAAVEGSHCLQATSEFIAQGFVFRYINASTHVTSFSSYLTYLSNNSTQEHFFFTLI